MKHHLHAVHGWRLTLMCKPWPAPSGRSCPTRTPGRASAARRPLSWMPVLSSSVSLPCRDHKRSLRTTLKNKALAILVLACIPCRLVWALVAVKVMGDLLLMVSPTNVPWRPACAPPWPSVGCVNAALVYLGDCKAVMRSEAKLQEPICSSRRLQGHVPAPRGTTLLRAINHRRKARCDRGVTAELQSGGP